MTIRIYDLAGASDDVRFSPPCWRTKMALAHKGLSFEAVMWRFTEKETLSALGHSTVPVMVDGDTVIGDSFKIAHYLDAQYPDRPMLFEGPQGVALTSFIQTWCERTLNPILIKMIIMDLFNSLHEKDKAYFRQSREARFGKTLEEVVIPAEEGVKALHQALQPMRAMLLTQPFFCGAAPAYADYAVFGSLQWARTVSSIVLVQEDDAVHAWNERMLDLFDGLARNAPRHTA